MRTIFHVDTFTSRVLEGNPASVVQGADALPDTTLAAVTRELGHETAFVCQPTRPSATHRVRFFTLAGEVAVSGHAALAAAFVLHEGGAKGAIVLECRAGDLPVLVEPTVDAGGARRGAPRIAVGLGKPLFGELPMRGVVSQAVNLPPDVVAPRPAPALVSVGEWVVLLPVTSPDVLSHAVPLATKIGALGGTRAARGIYLVALDAEAGPVTRVAARFFGSPKVGSAEDAASGTAAGALAGWLAKSGRLAPGSELLVTQGEAMQRPSTLQARVADDGRAWIAGHAVLAMQSSASF